MDAAEGKDLSAGIPHMAVPENFLVKIRVFVLEFFDSAYKFRLGAVYAVDDIY